MQGETMKDKDSFVILSDTCLRHKTCIRCRVSEYRCQLQNDPAPSLGKPKTKYLPRNRITWLIFTPFFSDIRGERLGNTTAWDTATSTVF